MSVTRFVKRQCKSMLPPLIFMGLVSYFVWNVVNGDRGLKATAIRMDTLQMAQSDLTLADTERDGWERRVAGLRPGHLESDTLDERARAMLNLANSDDVVVLYPKNGRLF